MNSDSFNVSLQHQRLMYIDKKYHFIKAKEQKGIKNCVYNPSEQSVTSIFTKSATGVKLKTYVNVFMRT